jgi:hypothetical protein
MVLKHYFAVIFFFFATLHAKSEVTLVHTDNFEVNYYTSSHAQLSNKLFVGNDMFRFLTTEQIEKCAEYILQYLNQNGIASEQNFEKHKDNALAFKINISDGKQLVSLAPAWKRNFEKEWTNLLFDFTAEILESRQTVFPTSVEGIMYSILQLEKKNKLSEYNLISKTGLAFVTVENYSKHFLDNRYIYTRNNRDNNTLLYNEIIQVENLTRPLEYAFPLVNKKSNVSECLALNIIKDAAEKMGDIDILYGVNQSVMIAKNIGLLNDSVIFQNINKDNFEALKIKALEHMQQSIGSENLFFYAKKELELMHIQLPFYTFNDFKRFVTDLNNSKYVIAISQNKVEHNGQNLQSANITLFDFSFSMKQNSIKFVNENDEAIADRIALFMNLNPEIGVSILGKATLSEIIKIEKKKVTEIIKKHNQSKSEYSVSRRANIGLLRAMHIYNLLVEKGVDKNRLKCNGTVSSKYSPEVSFMLFSFSKPS